MSDAIRIIDKAIGILPHAGDIAELKRLKEASISDAELPLAFLLNGFFRLLVIDRKSIDLAETLHSMEQIYSNFYQHYVELIDGSHLISDFGKAELKKSDLIRMKSMNDVMELHYSSRGMK
ncbi:hypothetical protein [Vibrio coralliirubri]|uniref:hypothetical protein n=1 Tax=Vibrio coralliirubri TaxID=1516159 RepID=UPI000638D72D|nr:hypothetical protein [Vibrio coralliirubri]CDT47777.1 hypothetical protein VCR6J2_470081 [Vibrio coralliirubri]